MILNYTKKEYERYSYNKDEIDYYIKATQPLPSADTFVRYLLLKISSLELKVEELSKAIQKEKR